MKYFWLEKYLKYFKNFTSDDINTKEYKKVVNDFYNDFEFYITHLNYSKERYELIKKKPISKLNDYELFIMFYYTVMETTIINGYLNKILLDKSLYKLIKYMVKVPDTNLPITDYTFKEIVEEIKNLKTNLPTKDKIKNNNVCACYNCHSIYYVDNIHAVDENRLLLCPYCMDNKLYFDNDYIPMNNTFLRLATLYYKDNMKDIIDLYKDKVILKDKVSNNKSLYLDLSNTNILKDKELEYNKTTNKYEVSCNLLLNGHTSKEELLISSTIYKYLLICEKNKYSEIEINLNDNYYHYSNDITINTIIVTILEYLSKHYFTNINKMTIISKNLEFNKLYNSTIKELDNLSK